MPVVDKNPGAEGLSLTRTASRRVSPILVALMLLCAFLSGCSSQLVSGWLSGGEGFGEVRVTIYRVADGDTIRVSPEIEGED